MTYLQFHLIFNLPVILFLLWLNRKLMRPAHWKWIAVICVVVVVFTFPWDSWAVSEGIWGFTEGRVAAFIGNLPVEEVSFFLLETFVASLLLIWIISRTKTKGQPASASKEALSA